MNLYPRFYSIIIRGALDCVLNSMCYCDRIRIGAIAQLGERFAGSEEVVGSIPSSSTKNLNVSNDPSCGEEVPCTIASLGRSLHELVRKLQINNTIEKIDSSMIVKLMSLCRK